MKKLFSLVASFAMMLSLVACGGGSSAGDTLVYGAEELEGIFSPLYYSSSYDGYVVDLVHEKLLTYNENNELTPQLATEIPEWSNGNKTLTFKLNEGVKFSDGSDFNAEDVKLTFEVLADGDYAGRNGYLVESLEGYADYHYGTDADGNPVIADKDDEKKGIKQGDRLVADRKTGKFADEVSGIKIIDDYTIQFNFTEASSEWIYYIGNMGIISSEQFKDYENGKATSVVEAAIGEPIGTGPYVLNSYSKSEGASLVKSETYKGEGYEIASVIIKPVDMSTEYEELKSGNIDMLQQSIEPSKVGPATKNEDLTINSYPRAGYGFVCFNTASGATADQGVRQALMYAFNRKAFVESYFKCDKCAKGTGTDLGYVPATIQNPASPMGDIVTGKETVEGLNTYEYSIENANAALDTAGWAMGDDGFRYKNGEKLTVKMMAMEDHDICNTLIPMWKSDWGSIGVDFMVTTVDFNTLLNKVQNDDALSEWNVFFMANSFTDSSMGGIYSTYISSQAKTGGQNYSRLKNAELDAILNQALFTQDEDAAKALWTQAAIMINDQASYMPVYGNTYYEMFSKKVKNMTTNTLYPWTSGLRNASLDK